MNFDTIALLPTLTLMAKASSAVYEIDPHKQANALEALGLRFVGLVNSPERWITVTRWGNRNLIVVQGTRVTSNFDAAEGWDDLDLMPHKTSLGLVPCGFYQPIVDLAPRVKELLDPSLPTDATGHSLGGQTAQLMPALLPIVTAYPIAAPTGASHDFWNATRDCPKIALYHERDFARGWGVGLDWHQPPDPFLWLRQGRLIEATGRDGINVSVGDHSIDAYVAALEAVAARVKSSAA